MAAFTIARAEFAQAVGAGQGKPILVGLDSAGGPVSAPLQVPVGLPRHCLPPYAPDLQPAERLRPLTNEALANKHFHALDERQEGQTQRCLALQARPTVIPAHTPCHGWPQSA
jgi:hypothetical protein